MQLILFRHGNTFSAGEKPVWVGKKQDLPLVEKGKTQAVIAGQILSEMNIYPDAIYCSSLKRTKEFAQIIAQELSYKGRILEDIRLDELDYGLWSGLTSEEIAARGWVIDLQQWNDFSVWPESGQWEDSPEALVGEVEEFTQDLIQTYSADATIVGVTSNGRIRYFLSLDQASFKEALSREKVKVKTGHAAIFNLSAKGIQMLAWDVSPEMLANVLEQLRGEDDN